MKKTRAKHLKLTPDLLKLNYEMNKACAPFNRWNLPPSESIIFKVTRDRRVAGYHKTYTNGTQEIGISQRCVGTLVTLTRIMQHEQIHVRQENSKPKTSTPGVEHNAEFRRLSDQVCDIHIWDRMEFADADLA